MSYLYEDFVADALKIRDDIACDTGVALEFGYSEYYLFLAMIKDIERSLTHEITDHDDLIGIVLAERGLGDEEYAAFKRLLDKYYEREKFYTRQAMDEKHGRYAPTPPIEAYEEE